MKHFLLLFLAITVSSVTFSFAQGTFQPKRIDNTAKGVIYRKENTFDTRLHTNYGIAMGLTFGKVKTFYKSSFYRFEIGSLKHPKETKQNFDYQIQGSNQTSKRFVYGKQNHLLIARASFGRKTFLTEKAKKRGLSIGYTYALGANIGLLKPYYLELLKLEDGIRIISTEKYSDDNAFLFLDETNIFGAANFFKGINEVSVIPGGHVQLGAIFDWGAFDEFIKAMEIGIMLDVFPKKVPIMVENNDITNSENRPFFINFYISLQLGKRTY